MSEARLANVQHQFLRRTLLAAAAAFAVPAAVYGDSVRQSAALHDELDQLYEEVSHRRRITCPLFSDQQL